MPSAPWAATEVAIVAAMDREIEPLLDDWREQDLESGGRRLRFWEKLYGDRGRAVLVCGGIGPAGARAAAEAACELYRPRILVSAGYAGSLSREHQVGDVLVASAVIDVMHDKNYPGRGYDGIVVSSPGIADAAEKAALRQRYGADAVDLEAAAVAQVAAERGVEFYAVKAISDESSAALPPFARFIEDGRFREWRFALHCSLRPWMWPRVARIARDSALASERLCEFLAERLESGQWGAPRSKGMRRVGSR